MLACKTPTTLKKEDVLYSFEGVSYDDGSSSIEAHEWIVRSIQTSSRGIVPPNDRKGDIARIAQYMQSKYGVKYSKRQQALFDKWMQQDPVSEQEIKRDNKIIKTQGYGLDF